MIRQILFPGLLETGRAHDGIFAIRDGFVNLFVLEAEGGLVCIDAGWNLRRIRRGFDALGFKVDDVVAVCLTHLDWDHARGLNLFPNADAFAGEHEIPARSPGRHRDLFRDGHHAPLHAVLGHSHHVSGFDSECSRTVWVLPRRCAEVGELSAGEDRYRRRPPLPR